MRGTVVGVHLEKLPSGRWRAVVQHQGRKRSVTADTRGAAQQAGAAVLLSLGATPRMSVTLVDLLAGHLAQLDRAPGTVADYHYVLERLTTDAPDFLAGPAEQRLPVHFEALYGTLAGLGWSGHRLGRLHDLFSTAYQRAARHGWVAANPLRDVRRPAIQRAKIDPPDRSTLAMLIAAAPPDFALFLRLAATTGARRGELVGLQWADVDFDLATLRIARSLRYSSATGQTVGEGKTGSKGHRTVSIPVTLVPLLSDALEHHRRLAGQHDLPEPVWVFSHDAGVTPWRTDYPSLKFRRLRESCGVTGVRLHDLRHFVATEMLAAGMSPVATAARLGHTTPAVTLRTYAHWIPAADRDAADLLGGLIE
jgi:integrase